MKDKSHVTLCIGPATPILLLATPVLVGVKIRPSVLYSYTPAFCPAIIVLQHMNIFFSPETISNFLTCIFIGTISP